MTQPGLLSLTPRDSSKALLRIGPRGETNKPDREILLLRLLFEWRW